MYGSVALSTFIVLGNHHHCLFPKLFHPPDRNSGPPLPQPLVDYNLLSVSKNLPVWLRHGSGTYTACPSVPFYLAQCFQALHVAARVSTSFLLVG